MAVMRRTLNEMINGWFDLYGKSRFLNVVSGITFFETRPLLYYLGITYDNLVDMLFLQAIMHDSMATTRIVGLLSLGANMVNRRTSSFFPFLSVRIFQMVHARGNQNQAKIFVGCQETKVGLAVNQLG